ncbi:hypothetical protein WR25_12150 [Diploscapter pachys]|uniref:Uncharacterized protein n=1 Tax=Diploscapter pachys TaxID=2018661 RepID=A0A2A2K1B0_9BILA|nr:hypothetical protein WR25_12150 [Diploscapter pachys]
MIALAPSAVGPSRGSSLAIGSSRNRLVAAIRNGVVAIDSVMIAPNRLAASGAIRKPDCACANSTKPNSPPWLSSSPSASALRHVILNAMPMPVMTAVLVTISAAAIAATNSGRSAIACRSSIMPTARKNRPSKIDRNGSTSASSSCRYGLSASITPAMNAPSAVDRPSASINAALAMTVNSAANTNISRSPRLPIRRNSGRSRNLPARISPTTAPTVYSASSHPGGPPASAGLRLIAATIVIRGTIDRSWNSRIENARSPNGVRSRPDDCSIGSTCAVDDSANHTGDGKTAGDDLQQPQPENLLLHPPQPRRVQFQSHDEQQQRDAEFGDPHLRFGIADEAQHMRPDDRTRDQEAQRRTQADPAEQQHEPQAEAQQDHPVAEHRHAFGRLMHRPSPRAPQMRPLPPPRTPAGSKGAARYSPVPA